MTEQDHETLVVLRAQSGDRQALEALFRAIEKPVFKCVAALVEDHHTAEDLLQNVLVLVYRKLRWLRNPQLFRPWVYRLATREAFHAVRRERRWREQIRDDALLESLPDSEPGEFDSEFADRIPDLLETVSPASRIVLALHFLQGLTLEETSAALEIPLGTVKSRLAYGLRCLRDRVRKETMCHE